MELLQSSLRGKGSVEGSLSALGAQRTIPLACGEACSAHDMAAVVSKRASEERFLSIGLAALRTLPGPAPAGRGLWHWIQGLVQWPGDWKGGGYPQPATCRSSSWEEGSPAPFWVVGGHKLVELWSLFRSCTQEMVLGSRCGRRSCRQAARIGQMPTGVHNLAHSSSIARCKRV